MEKEQEYQKAPVVKNHHYCRVCGLDCLGCPWGIDGASPSFEICDCCGTEAGYEDLSLVSIRKQREKWFISGYPWFNLKKKPDNWSAEVQLNNIQQEYL